MCFRWRNIKQMTEEMQILNYGVDSRFGDRGSAGHCWDYKRQHDWYVSLSWVWEVGGHLNTQTFLLSLPPSFLSFFSPSLPFSLPPSVNFIQNSLNPHWTGNNSLWDGIRTRVQSQSSGDVSGSLRDPATELGEGGMHWHAGTQTQKRICWEWEPAF